MSLFLEVVVNPGPLYACMGIAGSPLSYLDPSCVPVSLCCLVQVSMALALALSHPLSHSVSVATSVSLDC
jgi:hypothetical protein